MAELVSKLLEKKSFVFGERSANIKESGFACFALMKVGKREGTWFGLGLEAFAMKQSLQARMKYLTWESS